MSLTEKIIKIFLIIKKHIVGKTEIQVEYMLTYEDNT